MDVVVLALAGTATALATGLGAIPVSRLGSHAEQLRPALWGLTVGLMSVASVLGLLLPALDEGSPGGGDRGAPRSASASWSARSGCFARARGCTSGS